MATVIADNIISPLGFSTEENYQAVKSGRTALCHRDTAEGIPFPFTASLFSEEQRMQLLIDGYTFFESLAIRSIRAALQQDSLSHKQGNTLYKQNNPLHKQNNPLLQKAIALDERTLLIISSAKANVSLLTDGVMQENVLSPAVAAQRIAVAVGVKTTPVVVSNACISGVSALILANRMLAKGEYDRCIVCGIDQQSPFIVSGFQSLKALSEDYCRPFDIERIGLNLGEAAATIVLSREAAQVGRRWSLVSGAVRNDAYHISSPQPQGVGCADAMSYVLRGRGKEGVALVNAHGTATMYNDQMESKAIERAGLADVPVNALKGYYGHTMGAAGVLETIITMSSLDDGTIIGTKGYDEVGVSGKVLLSSDNLQTKKTDFIKIVSGFGGCNAAIYLSREVESDALSQGIETELTHSVQISSSRVMVDGIVQETESKGKALLTELYKKNVGDYPKFYKMDGLARLGFIATELLLRKEKEVTEQMPLSDEDDDCTDGKKRGVVFFNKYASLNADRTFLATIADADNFYPSPSDFVYTLPNIVNGEIAIRHKCKGETCFYVLQERDDELMQTIVESTFTDDDIDCILNGWLEYEDDNTFFANINIRKRVR